VEREVVTQSITSKDLRFGLAGAAHGRVRPFVI